MTAKWKLYLYVNAQIPNLVEVVTNFKRICENHLKYQYTINAVDLSENPKQTKVGQSLVVSGLVREHLLPIRQIAGDLSIAKTVLESMKSAV